MGGLGIAKARKVDCITFPIHSMSQKAFCEALQLLFPMPVLTAQKFIELRSRLWVWVILESDAFIYFQAVLNNKVYKIKKASEGFVLIIISFLINLLFSQHGFGLSYMLLMTIHYS